MGRHSLKHKSIKQIIFHLTPNKQIIYDLTKDGRHTVNMKRAVRTNYKKLLKEKEGKEGKADCDDYENLNLQFLTLPEFTINTDSDTSEISYTPLIDNNLQISNLNTENTEVDDYSNESLVYFGESDDYSFNAY